MQAGRGSSARLFFALCPSDAARAALAELALKLHSECGGRPVPHENLHLTLAFLGPVERARIGALARAAAQVSAEAFDLLFERVGYWRHNRIVWAGTAQPQPAAAALESALRSVLAPQGVRGEDRPYVPHVTLLRNAERKPLTDRFVPALWRVDEFALVESVPSAGGVRYETLQQWPLREPR